MEVYLKAYSVKLVGIDSHNIDSTLGKTRPVHSILLGAEILIVEHLCNLYLLLSGPRLHCHAGLGSEGLGNKQTVFRGNHAWPVHQAFGGGFILFLTVSQPGNTGGLIATIEMKTHTNGRNVAGNGRIVVMPTDKAHESRPASAYFSLI